MQTQRGHALDRREGVEVELAVRTEPDTMRPVFAGQPLQSRTVHVDAVQLLFDRGFLERREVDPIPLLVDVGRGLPQRGPHVRGPNRPSTARDLPHEHEGAVEVVEVEVGVAVPLGDPHEPLLVLQKVKVVVQVDPTLVGLAQNRLGLTACGVDQEQIQRGLRAVECLDRQASSVGKPLYAHEVLVGIDAQVDPRGFAAFEIVHAGAHTRIGLAGLGITLVDHARYVGLEVDVAHQADAGIVGLQVGDRP